MKRLLLIVTILLGSTPTFAQNATVTGPKRHTAQARSTKAKRSSTHTKTGTQVRKAQPAISSPTGYINGHGYVDLGLNVKWATCNVGASSPNNYGGYYVWGATETMSKRYSNYGGFSDVAQVKWNASWRMPTYDELSELCQSCYFDWINYNGVTGYKVTGPSGESIFLPASGFWDGNNINNEGTIGYYRSSSVDSNNSKDGYTLFLGPEKWSLSVYSMSFGFAVRPVTD